VNRAPRQPGSFARAARSLWLLDDRSVWHRFPHRALWLQGQRVEVADIFRVSEEDQLLPLDPVAFYVASDTAVAMLSQESR